MTDDDRELAYYQAVEDYFAAARGVPHTLSPKDVQLLRGWWREQLPLEAVTAAIAEVFARRRERGEEDTPVSLGYCRHAVRRQARRLAQMRAGTAAGEDQSGTADEGLRRLAEKLENAAAAAADSAPAAAELIRACASALDGIADLDSGVLDHHLFNLEANLIDGVFRALPAADRELIETRAAASADRSGAAGDAWERAFRAMVDRELRLRFNLPRLELG